MKVKIHVSCWQDRRTPDLKLRDKSLTEKFWWARRRVEQERQVQVVSRLGEVGSSAESTPSRQGSGDRSGEREPDTWSGRAAANSTWQLVSVRSVRDGWTTLQRLREGKGG